MVLSIFIGNLIVYGKQNMMTSLPPSEWDETDIGGGFDMMKIEPVDSILCLWAGLTEAGINYNWCDLKINSAL